MGDFARLFESPPLSIDRVRREQLVSSACLLPEGLLQRELARTKVSQAPVVGFEEQRCLQSEITPLRRSASAGGLTKPTASPSVGRLSSRLSGRRSGVAGSLSELPCSRARSKAEPN